MDMVPLHRPQALTEDARPHPHVGTVDGWHSGGLSEEAAWHTGSSAAVRMGVKSSESLTWHKRPSY